MFHLYISKLAMISCFKRKPGRDSMLSVMLALYVKILEEHGIKAVIKNM